MKFTENSEVNPPVSRKPGRPKGSVNRGKRRGNYRNK